MSIFTEHDDTPGDAGALDQPLNNTEQNPLSGAPEQDSGPSSRRKFIERATIMGLGLSLLTHILILLFAALVTINFGFGDAGGGGAEDEVDFAILTNTQLAQSQAPKVEFETFEVTPSLAETVTPMELLSEISTEQSMSELAESITPSIAPGGGSLSSIETTTGDAGAGTGDGASFFGLEAQGSRFAYIVDISGSMNTLTPDGEATRWELTRSELIRSLAGLDTQFEFFVELYSSAPINLFGTTDWVKSGKSQKRLATSALFQVAPVGGTKPMPAFQQVFALKPTPDAIYFMTDGMIGNDVPALVRQLNRSGDIPIHCILFGSPGDEQSAKAAKNMLMAIARQSGGKFTHIKEGMP